MHRTEFVEFVRRRGVAVVATRASDGAPQAALIGVAATDRGEVVFDTARTSRKVANLSAFPRVALVIGWEDEVTLQCEGRAEVLATGADRERCLGAYLEQYPEGRERAADPDIVLVRVLIDWGRLSDYRPQSFGSQELRLGE